MTNLNAKLKLYNPAQKISQNTNPCLYAAGYFSLN